MRKYTPAIIAASVTLVLAGGAVAYGIYATKNKDADTVIASASATPAASAQGSDLSQTPVDTQNSSTLGVSSSPSSGASLQSNLGQQSAGTSGGAANGSSQNSSAVPGPESFAQYDKYKTAESAMYADLQVGTGNTVTSTSKVAVLYKGWLTNGQIFDQSRADDSGKLQAFVFTVGEHKVIPGWEQDIVGMKVGGTRRFIVPPAVGYGAEGHDPIPGNAVLVFDVQLVEAL